MKTQKNYASFGRRLAAELFDELLTIFSLGIYRLYSLYTISKRGETLGKKIMKIKIVNKEGDSRIGFGKMFLREVVGKFVDYLVFGIGALWMLIDSDKQGLHDKCADTFVINLN